jgi:hypothetical protein|tara:strand:- start:788 stop:943 length:156 start_codon:yes stop_codon:yes gene_type:complete
MPGNRASMMRQLLGHGGESGMPAGNANRRRVMCMDMGGMVDKTMKNKKVKK